MADYHAKGGRIGGRVRAERLSPERRREIATAGAHIKATNWRQRGISRLVDLKKIIRDLPEGKHLILVEDARETHRLRYAGASAFIMADKRVTIIPNAYDQHVRAFLTDGDGDGET